MAKNAVADWDSTAANNTDVGGINIQGTAAVMNMDNGMREIMAQIKNTVIGRSDFKSDSYALFHFGNRDQDNSGDPTVLVARNINDDDTGNAHGFSDSSNVSRSGTIGYNSYDATINITGTNDFDHYAAFQSTLKYGSSGTMSDYYGLVHIPIISAGKVEKSYGVEVWDATGAGTLETQYGFRVKELTKGTVANWAVYTEGLTQSYFGGKVLLGIGQIGFPASATASSDPNTLDDYEEGTWTPTVTANTGTLTSVTNKSARYTKIGNRVFVDIKFTVATNGTGGGWLAVDLPFTNGSVDSSFSAITTAGLVMWAGVTAATDEVLILKYDGSYPGADGAQFIISGSYAV